MTKDQSHAAIYAARAIPGLTFPGTRLSLPREPWHRAGL